MKLRVIFLSLIAFVATACEKIDGDTSSYYIDDSYGSQSQITESQSEFEGLNLLRGLAADGASRVDILIPVAKSNLTPQITFEAESEQWGSAEYLGKSAFESDNYNFYRYSITSEERLPAALSSDSIAYITYDIKVADGSGTTLSLPVTLSVIRPAAIFVHGIASNAATYDPMLGYIRPMGLYLEASLYAVDYMKTSLSSYATNLNVIPDAIALTRSTLLESGFVNEKFTIVGHSMGGILTRLYIQNESDEYPYSDDILKIITIDTPHSGSQLADFALTLGGGDESNPLSIFSAMGAIVDLAVESEATANLNDSAKLEAANDLAIPTHIISAHIGTTLDVAQLIKEKQYIFAATTFLINAIGQKYIYGDDDNDFVVPMSSQLGGVSDTWRTDYITTYSNEWHCSVHTTEEAADDIVELFSTEGSDDTIFTTSFAPEVLSYSGGVTLDLAAVTTRPDLSSVDAQLIIGLSAEGDILTVAYDDSSSSSFALSDEQLEGVASELYIARLSSGGLRYCLTDL